MLTLLECMKNNLPSNDGSKFKTTESHLDWEKVAFKDFSGEMCKMKWMEISNEVTDSRTRLGGVSARGTEHPSDLPGLFESLKFSAWSPWPLVPIPSHCRRHREPLGGTGTGRLHGGITKPHGFMPCRAWLGAERVSALSPMRSLFTFVALHYPAGEEVSDPHGAHYGCRRAREESLQGQKAQGIRQELGSVPKGESLPSLGWGAVTHVAPQTHVALPPEPLQAPHHP